MLLLRGRVEDDLLDVGHEGEGTASCTTTTFLGEKGGAATLPELCAEVEGRREEDDV